MESGFPITAKEENGSIIIIGNNQRNSLSLLNWQHVKDYAGSDTCPLFYPPELRISYASSSKWCGSKGGMKEVERKLSGENLLCLCHDKLDQRCQDLGT